MKIKGLLIGVGALFAIGLFPSAVHADTPRTDMVDVSNHNGQMTAPEFTYMRNNNHVKAVATKISEGVGFHDYTARGNIASAKQAGLYINGYHFLHATNVAGAIREADYAVQMAKADGLPTGAVLAVDIEFPYQLAKGSAMQPVATAFENEVMRAGGYRSTTYTGGYSSSVSPAGEKAWLAQYPYVVSSASQLYNQDHGWQWSSKFKFASSLGTFDVTQLYDDFFTASQDVVPNQPKQPAKPVKPNNGASSYAISQFRNHGNRFTAYKSFKIDKIAFVNGMWQGYDNEFAGGTNGSWKLNGLPLSMLDNLTRGNTAPTHVGDTMRIKAGFNRGTIDAYDTKSNGVGIVEGQYGMIWYDASALLNR